MQVLVVDDHPVVISGCRAMLGGYSDIKVIHALDSEGAFKLFVSEHPSVVVIDVELPDVSGFMLMRRILEHDRGARILIFTMNDDPVIAARAIDGGAKGYISKCEHPERFVAAVRALAMGQTFLAPELAQTLAFTFGSDRGANLLDQFDTRELEILRLLRKGKSMVEIAGLINVSYKTVANSCSNLKSKLRARTPLDLVRIAVEKKLI